MQRVGFNLFFRVRRIPKNLVNKDTLEKLIVEETKARVRLVTSRLCGRQTRFIGLCRLVLLDLRINMQDLTSAADSSVLLLRQDVQLESSSFST